MSVRRVLINSMILFLLVLFGSWFGPFPNQIRGPAERCMTALGFRQNWGMFAPNVGTTNGHSYAAITYNDGLVRCCETPYLWVMNEFYKYRYEKYEAYFEALDFDFNYDLKPSVCAYFARAFFDPKNPVYMVSLSAKGASYPVHPFVLQSELPEHTETSTCFNFKPQQGD